MKQENNIFYDNLKYVIKESMVEDDTATVKVMLKIYSYQQ